MPRALSRVCETHPDSPAHIRLAGSTGRSAHQEFQTPDGAKRMTANLEIANTIWKQIPVMTKMAVGARKPVVIDSGIKFNFGRGNRRWITVELKGDDTYTVTATRMTRNYKLVALGDFAGVYCDMLSEIIYSLTHS
jgi:hypothetical protein